MSSRHQNGATGKRGKPSARPAKPNGSWKPVFAGNSSAAGDGDEDNDDLFNENKYCVVCAEKLVFASKSPCNHTTCHICSFRQRALYKKKACLVCRTENEDLIITETLDGDYQQFQMSATIRDSKFMVSFTSQEACDGTLSLLDFNCVKCTYVASDLNQLMDHLKTEHDRYLCSLCSTNKKAFPHELNVYSQKQLQTHLIKGDENDENFKGHPICKFCKGKRFYSSDELDLHYRKNHEECHVCKTIDAQNPQYFKNYESLEEHFRTDHYICTVQSCLDRKFVVFGDELDLRAHLVTEHPTLYGSNFVYGSNSNKLHSQLSTFRAPKRKTQSSESESSDSMQTKRLRLEERARHYLNYDNEKFIQFKELHSSFLNSYITAHQLKDSITRLFASNSAEEVNLLLFDLTETLNKNTERYDELSTLVSKQKQILDQRNDEMFPALQGSSSSVNLAASWVNPTAKSKRQQSKQFIPPYDSFPPLPIATKKRITPATTSSSSSSSTTWTANGTRVATTSTVKRPVSKTKPAVVSVSKKPVVPVAIPNYLDAKKSSSSASSSSKKPAFELNERLFPALPAQAKKAIPRVNPIPQGNGQWDSASSVLSSAASSANSSVLDMTSLGNALSDSTVSSSNGGRKGKKQKKQILFQMGGRG